jgi:predicted ATPase
VAAGLGTAMEAVEVRCEALARHGQFLRGCGVEEWPDGTVAGRYAFLHALYQQVVYQQLPVGRQMQIHGKIGVREEAGYGERTSEVAAELAVHFERGRDPSRAVRYRRQAADTALQRHAYREAVTHLTTALALLTAMPETPARAQQEIELQIALGSALMVTKGYAAPEVEHAYLRARELCQQMGDISQFFSALRGLWQFYHNQGALQTARELGERLYRLARCPHNSTFHLLAHAALGTTMFSLGEFALARTYLEQGIALDDYAGRRDLAVRYGIAPGIQCRAVLAQALWRLGYPDQALRQSHEACTEARELVHPPSLAFALYYATRLHIHRREVQATQAQAEVLMTLSTEHGFAQRVAAAMFFRGWSLAMLGYGDIALAQMSQGLTAVLATGQAIIRPIFLTLLSEVYGKEGRADEALSLLAEAQAAMDENGRSDLKAEIDRLKGTLLLQQAEADMSKAESCFRQALDIAHHQGAKSLELRAAISLSRLWQGQGKRDVARALLAPIYGWFTEGFDTADLQEAQTLLEELA